MKMITALILIVIAAIGISFAALNADLVTINYYIGKCTVPLSLLLLGVFIIGIMVGYIASWLSCLRHKLEMKHWQKE